MDVRKSVVTTSVTILLILVTFSIADAQSAKQAQRAINTVTTLYKAHKKRSIAQWNRVELKKYFDLKLANAIYKVTHGEEGIDFDILYDTQDDSDIKNFKISGGDLYHDQYLVSVGFKSFGEEKNISFHLNKTFKIEAVEYIGGGSLIDILTDTGSN